VNELVLIQIRDAPRHPQLQCSRIIEPAARGYS
jgi:hypothetical protein